MGYMKERKINTHSVDIYIGKQLRKKRIELQWSQERLGQEVSLTFQQIQKYELGISRISAHKIYELANSLNTSINYFFKDLYTQSKCSKNANDPNFLLPSKKQAK